MSQYIILLCGLSFSGKTTLGKALEEELTIPFLDIDAARQELSAGTEWLGPDKEKEIMAEAYRLNHEKARLILLSGKSVIIGATYSRPEYHASVTELAKSSKVNLFAFYLSIPENQVIARLELRIRNEGNSNIKTIDAYEEQKRRYQRITNARLLEGTTPLRVLVEEIRDIVDPALSKLNERLRICSKLLELYEVGSGVELGDIKNFKVHKSHVYGHASIYQFDYGNKCYYVTDDYSLGDDPQYIKDVLEEINSALQGRLLKNPTPQSDGAVYASGLDGVEYYLWEYQPTNKLYYLCMLKILSKNPVAYRLN